MNGGCIQKNLNGNKSIYVEREIGKRPVLAFLVRAMFRQQRSRGRRKHFRMRRKLNE